jgi:hypothetical protein
MKKLITVLTIVLTLLCSTVFSFAAEDPNVMLVNPASYSNVYSNNLLISVKITQPKTIRVSFYEEMQMVSGTLAAVNITTQTTGSSLSSSGFYDVAETSGTFTSTNNLSFYTKQVNNLSPGLYKIQIDTLDSSNKVIYSTSSYVSVKEKTVTSEEKILDSPQSGTMQFLQNLLKTIFGD